MAGGGRGGAISIAAGAGDYGDGGDLTVVAGEATAAAARGGAVTISGGEGSSVSTGDGGNGGKVVVEAGYSAGMCVSP